MSFSFQRTIITLCSLASLVVIIASCTKKESVSNFGTDLTFLKEHKEVIVLASDDEKQQIAIVPDYQGRVMTSSANGLEGRSYGWLNYDLISSGKFQPQINVFGGEDRFWLGPEGGQYAIFFKNGSDFDVKDWATPAPIDTEPFEVVETTADKARFTKKMSIINYQNYQFDLEVDRTIKLLDRAKIEFDLGIKLDRSLDYVGFESNNQIRNIGEQTWSKENGLLSIWILGMFNPSPETSVLIPYKGEPIVNSNYFGEVGNDRLQVNDGIVWFKGDGKYRSKIGLPAECSLPVLGSYDKKNQVLTIVKFSMSTDSTYVNSLWETQKEPYKGDVINSYNDGPMGDGSQLGPFYELETSSAAKELSPGEIMTHSHRTYHFEGDKSLLNALAKSCLGVDLDHLPGD